MAEVSRILRTHAPSQNEAQTAERGLRPHPEDVDLLWSTAPDVEVLSRTSKAESREAGAALGPSPRLSEGPDSECSRKAQKIRIWSDT
jgi:hypothetical protein